jgi:hypothetical protein
LSIRTIASYFYAQQISLNPTRRAVSRFGHLLDQRVLEPLRCISASIQVRRCAKCAAARDVKPGRRERVDPAGRPGRRLFALTRANFGKTWGNGNPLSQPHGRRAHCRCRCHLPFAIAMALARRAASQSLGLRSVHLRIQPRPSNLSESREIYRLLQRFGEISTYKYLRVRTTCP